MSADHILGRPYSVMLADSIKRPCEHTTLTVLNAFGSDCDDHETQKVQCDSCGGYFVATIWKTDKPTGLRAMTTAEVARLAA